MPAVRGALIWLQEVEPPRCHRFLVISIHFLCDLVPSNQVVSHDGGSCASSTKRGCLQQDNLSHHIEKVPAKDGKGWSTPSPSCPLLWLYRVHKSSAGIAGQEPTKRQNLQLWQRLQGLSTVSSDGRNLPCFLYGRMDRAQFQVIGRNERKEPRGLQVSSQPYPACLVLSGSRRGCSLLERVVS